MGGCGVGVGGWRADGLWVVVVWSAFWEAGDGREWVRRHVCAVGGIARLPVWVPGLETQGGGEERRKWNPVTLVVADVS